MYKIIIHKNVTKFLQSCSLPKKRLLKKKISFLAENPFSHAELDIKKLKGVKNSYRLKVGKIRIIYQVLENKLLVLIITGGYRGDIYKKKK